MRVGSPVQSDFVLQNFVAVFLDVMGTRDRLAELDAFPETPAERQAAVEILRGTLGVVLDIREKLNEALDTTRRFSVGDASTLPAELRDLYDFELKTFTVGFSDSFVLAVPLEEPEAPHKALVAIGTLIASAGSMMLDALSEGRALRGGIDLAPGLHLDNGELYGPALARPYVLESKCAEYPRIVVGDTLREFLDHHARPGSGSHSENLARKTAAKIVREHLCVDADGRTIVDWVPKMPPSAPGYDDVRADVGAAYDFAAGERVRFGELGDERLAERYARLTAYLHGRLLP